jgi:competence protein ComGC
MAAGNEPSRIIKKFFKLLKYFTLPVGFLILLLRVSIKLIIFTINNRAKNQRC